MVQILHLLFELHRPESVMMTYPPCKGNKACVIASKCTKGCQYIDFEKLPPHEPTRSKEILSVYLQGLLDVD